MKKSPKANSPSDALRLQDIPSIGPKAEEDFRIVGILKPKDLLKKDPYKLYVKLCLELGAYIDPCVLDQFICAVYFMEGFGNKQWWEFTKIRKEKFHLIEKKIFHLKK